MIDGLHPSVFLNRAEEMRVLAEKAVDKIVKKQLEQIALEYTRIAEQLVEMEKHRGGCCG